MKSNCFARAFILFALSFSVWVDDAQAYIDPGTGSMVIQSLVAAIAGGVFLIKTYWHKLRRFFSQKKDISPELEKDPTNQ